ncbi:hypothetical protein [Nocardia harenae]|uniref:hypothetical protein n=1 Tax=Nocardia harenae TaxID=358707 RepID=UPI000B15A9A8|nr:hypothetical protein [Nocardia harenae]
MPTRTRTGELPALGPADAGGLIDPRGTRRDFRPEPEPRPQFAGAPLLGLEWLALGGLG